MLIFPYCSTTFFRRLKSVVNTTIFMRLKDQPHHKKNKQQFNNLNSHCHSCSRTPHCLNN
ncbi:uncharacterized protein DS421_8g226070 [Arachis hypogaea]|nr:uncharacterized protein DS421_8g226070 [Arachis hypogaea]